MWTPLKLKIDETTYFLDQLRAHIRFPKLFLFYLSAFLSSARSVTFHMQKQFSAKEKELYERLRTEMLNDEVCDYFVEKRNHIEKRGYPPLSLSLLVAYKNEITGELAWYQIAGCHLFSGEIDEGLEFVDEFLPRAWDGASLSGTPERIEYEWKFPDFPSEATDVTAGCEEYAQRLWRFVAKFRTLWETENDPNAHEKKFAKWFRLDT